MVKNLFTFFVTYLEIEKLKNCRNLLNNRNKKADRYIFRFSRCQILLFANLTQPKENPSKLFFFQNTLTRNYRLSLIYCSLIGIQLRFILNYITFLLNTYDIFVVCKSK